MIRLPMATWTSPVALLVVLTTACGPGAPPTPTPARAAQPAPTVAATAVPVANPTAVPTAAPVATPTTKPPATPTSTAWTPKGKLTVAVASLHEETPHPFRQTAGGMTQQLSHLGEALTRWNQEGVKVPAIAQSWKIGSPGTLWEFTLKDGVKFHNGQTLTAEDVKFSIEAIMDPEFKNTGMSALKRVFDRIEMVDNLRFKLYSKTPVAILDQYANPWIAPKSYYQQLGEEEFSKRPVAAGPFKFVSWKRGESLEFEAFEGFYDRARLPHAKSLVFKIVPEPSTRMAAFKVGEVDMIDQVPFHLLSEIKAMPGYKTFASPYSGYSELTFTDLIREGPSPFKDRRVRQALIYAIDRDALIKRLYLGEAQPQVVGGFLPHLQGYDRSLKAHPYDPEKAKALLVEAGFRDGFATEITFFESPAVAGIPVMVEAIAGYWAKVGVQAKLSKMETGIFMGKFRDKSLPAVPVLAGTLGRDVGQQAETFYITGGPWSYWSNPEMDTLLATHMTIMDPAKRDEQLKKIVRLVYEELPRIPLLAVNAIAGAGPRVLDWKRIPGSPYVLALESVALKD